MQTAQTGQTTPTETQTTQLTLPPVPKGVPPAVTQAFASQRATNAPTVPSSKGAPGNALEIRFQTGKGKAVVPDVVVDPPTAALRPEVQQMVSAASKRFVTEGYRGLTAYVAQQELIGQTSRMHSGARALHDLDVSLNKAILGGEPGIAARLTEIDQLFVTALMTPEQSTALREEHVALKALRETFSPLTTRRADIERVTLAGNLGPVLALTYAVEQTALNALIDGGARLEALQAGTLSKDAERETGLVKNVVDAAATGTTGIAARIAAIAHTRMVARLTPEGSEALTIEEKVLASLARELEKAVAP